MKIISLLPSDKRQNYKCHFCDTNLSVKYVVEITDKVIDPHKPIRTCCCNKCITLFGSDENCKAKQVAPREVTVEVITRTVVTVKANNADDAKMRAFHAAYNMTPDIVETEILDVQPIEEV